MLENKTPGRINEDCKTDSRILIYMLIAVILFIAALYFVATRSCSPSKVNAKPAVSQKVEGSRSNLSAKLPKSNSFAKASKVPEPLHSINTTVDPNSPTMSGITVYSVKAKKKLIALTFDDGPDSNYTDKILGILKQYNIKATFFVIGQNVERYPDCLKRIQNDGHVIGNHTYNHVNLDHLSAQQVQSEIEKTQNKLDSIIGHSLKIMRPPFGAASSRTRKIVNGMGYSIIDWSVDTKDWAGTSSSRIMDTVLRETKPGGIILHHCASGMHNLDNEILILPREIATLKSNGYQFVTVPELINEGNK